MPSMAALEAVSALGAWVGAVRDLAELSRFLDECQRSYMARNYLTAPLTPDDVASLRRSVQEGLRSADPRVRADARRLRTGIDFDLLAQCSEAYWGKR